MVLHYRLCLELNVIQLGLTNLERGIGERMEKAAIFLGAGASKSEGAPLQNELFANYFGGEKYRSSHGAMEKELASFFQFIFGINVDNDDLSTVTFPTFEEALGILDLAERRNEAFKEFDLQNNVPDSDRIRMLRQQLVLLMAKCIGDSLVHDNGYHHKLVNNLEKSNLLMDTTFISANYDILIDNALANRYPDFSLDYGVEFTNFDKEGDWKRPKKNAVNLFKIHGSLNWCYCRTCNKLTLTPRDKGILRLITDPESLLCQECESLAVPVIVPPTFYKDMSNIFLGIIWNKTEQALRKAQTIIFCGYSFPDADMHIKYLLKRIQTNRQIPLLKIVVCNHYTDKNKETAKEEEIRYKRFLGSKVKYEEVSFEQFANNPLMYIG